MPPKPCPPRLKRLIKRVNAGSADEAHALRQILRAFHARRQNKGADTIAIQSLSEITINLTEYKVTVVSELAKALDEIDSWRVVDSIRECVHPTCSQIFWAGRADKEACDKHAQQWRKTRQRRKERENQAEAHARREEAQLKRTITRLSPTAHAVISAIMANQKRVFLNIDDSAASYLYGTVLHVPSRYIVRQTLTMLVRRGYLDYFEDVNHNEDRYSPRQKLIDLWSSMQRKPTDE